MVPRNVLLITLSFILFVAKANAQPGDRHLDMKAQVLELAFPLNISAKPFLSKIVLRFGDSDTQITVVIYPGGKSELIRYSLAGMTSGELSQLISKMVVENPDVKAQEIAAKLKVDVSRTVLEQGALDRALDELKAIQISPVLASRVAVDEFSEYEFWYDTWQESVHYIVTSPFQGSAQDRLGKWMVEFRANLPKLLKTSLGLKP